MQKCKHKHTDTHTYATTKTRAHTRHPHKDADPSPHAHDVVQAVVNQHHTRAHVRPYTYTTYTYTGTHTRTHTHTHTTTLEHIKHPPQATHGTARPHPILIPPTMPIVVPLPPGRLFPCDIQEAAQAQEDRVLPHMLELNDAKMYRSAELLGNYAVIPKEGICSAQMADAFADACAGQGDYKRAAQYYRQGWASAKALERVPGGKSSAEVVAAIRTFKYKLMQKLAQCLIDVKQHKEALEVLNKIPSRQRTLPQHMMIGRLHRRAVSTRDAATAYKEALKKNPYAVEALSSLLELGVKPNNVLAYFKNDQVALRLFDSFIRGRAYQTKHQYLNAIRAYESSNKTQFCNLELMRSMAMCSVYTGSTDKAEWIFERIHDADHLYLDSMDTYGSLIKCRGKVEELNRLALHVMQTNDQRPEPWTVTALYYEIKGNRERALECLNKALHLNPRHPNSHLARGSLLLSLGHADEAAEAFRCAYIIRRDFSAYQGIVRSYLASSKTKEGLAVAKEAYRQIPNNAKALALYAFSLAHYAEGREEARNLYKQALEIDGGSLDAIVGLAQTFVLDQKPKKAIKILKLHIEQAGKEVLHVRLAEILVLVQKYSEAAFHFQEALKLNPTSESARKGLERIEKGNLDSSSAGDEDESMESDVSPADRSQEEDGLIDGDDDLDESFEEILLPM